MARPQFLQAVVAGVILISDDNHFVNFSGLTTYSHECRDVILIAVIVAPLRRCLEVNCLSKYQERSHFLYTICTLQARQQEHCLNLQCKYGSFSEYNS